jgi:hypothetical protein
LFVTQTRKERLPSLQDKRIKKYAVLSIEDSGLDGGACEGKVELGLRKRKIECTRKHDSPNKNI